MPSPSQKPHVLVADDDEIIRKLLSHQLKKAGFVPVVAEDGAEAMALASDEISAAILDLQMPHADGFSCLEFLRDQHPDIAVIMLSSEGEIEDAVRALKAGALDYLTKPFDPDELIALLRQATRVTRLSRENRDLRQSTGFSRPRSGFMGRSPAALDLLARVERVADLDNNILVTGESGVGKSLLARIIHDASRRAGEPFVCLSCPAIPRDLIESEIFGHEKGSFTGAHERRSGKIELAGEGTLFLDEIGDLPLDLQPKLLNVLQDRVFHRVGGSKTLEASCRLVTATNVDLRQLVDEKAFREDLYYRLNVIPLHIPPLRERIEDIEELACFFLERIAKDRDLPAFGIDDDAMAILRSYAWPGNVRELENVLERATAFCTSAVIGKSDLPADITTPGSSSKAGEAGAVPFGNISLADIERIAIQETLRRCDHNKAKSARVLGISEKSIYNKMRRLGLNGEVRK